MMKQMYIIHNKTDTTVRRCAAQIEYIELVELLQADELTDAKEYIYIVELIEYIDLVELGIIG